MKKIRLLFTIPFLLLSSTVLFAQGTFSVSPGVYFNSANFGFQLNKNLTVYGGFQYLSGEFSYNSEYTDYDYFFDRVVDIEDEETLSANVFFPTVGIKYYAFENEGLKSYLNLNISKPFIKLNYEYNGDEDEYLEDFDEKFKSLGLELGFGAEYLFSQRFSIGGEFGIRSINMSYEEDFEDEFYNPDTNRYEPSMSTEILSLKLSPTYSRISVNFYF